MKKAKIPTIIGIFILIVGIVAGVFLVQNQQIFRLRASPEITPKDFRKTNISDLSFSISWTTDKETKGAIRWGEDASNPDKTAVSLSGKLSTVHYINLTGLKPQTNYFVKIISDGKEFDNNGIPWEVKTGPTIPAPESSIVISGKIVTTTGSPAFPVIVHANVGGGGMISTTTSENGSWILPASSSRTKDLSSFIPIDESSTLVEVFAQGGVLGVASAQIYPQSAKPAPDITLGETFDFKNLPPSKDSEIPGALIDLPESATRSSKFSLGGAGQAETNSVTLNSLGEGEIVTTTEPEFFGEGPPGTNITVTVESEPITENVTVGSGGNWSWSPPTGLEEGFHKITLTWRDASGALRTLSRSFIVQAQEGPAFISTPSATPLPTFPPTSTPSPAPSPTGITTGTPTPSPSPSPTKTPTPTTTATDSGLPVVGFGFPTILLLLFGISFIAFGAVIFSQEKI